MNPLPRFLLLTLFACVSSLQSSLAQNWFHTTAVTNGSYQSIAGSADGSRYIYGGARISQPIYVSGDGGTNWTLTSAPPGSYWSVASSADGQKLVVPSGIQPNFIYTSTDAGASWASNNLPTKFWGAVSSSADGQKLAAIGSQSIFISADAGTNWIQSTNAQLRNWSCVASSTDGIRLLAGDRFPGGVFISTNSGIHWTACTNLPTSALWLATASSADGRRLFAVNGDALFYSKNFGLSWASNGLPQQKITSAACAASADGSSVIIAGSSFVATSTDSGGTLISNSVPKFSWSGVTVSADGSKFVATGSGGVWISQSTPNPSLRATLSTTNVLLSWIIPSTPFVLQSSTNGSPASWLNLTNVPSLNLTNLEYEVSLPVSVGVNFFRLKTP